MTVDSYFGTRCKKTYCWPGGVLKSAPYCPPLSDLLTPVAATYEYLAYFGLLILDMAWDHRNFISKWDTESLNTLVPTTGFLLYQYLETFCASRGHNGMILVAKEGKLYLESEEGRALLEGLPLLSSYAMWLIFLLEIPLFPRSISSFLFLPFLPFFLFHLWFCDAKD